MGGYDGSWKAGHASRVLGSRAAAPACSAASDPVCFVPKNWRLMMKRSLMTASAVMFALTAMVPSVSAADQSVPPVQFSNPLPKILSPDKFDHPVLKRAYAAAGRNREIVATLPCYCWCSKMGHRSLLDCFASNHGANCDVCIKEVLLADEMIKKGKTAAQIRAAVIQKEYEKVQLK